MEVVIVRHVVRMVGRMLGDAGALPECEVKTLMTPDHTAFQVRSSE